MKKTGKGTFLNLSIIVRHIPISHQSQLILQMWQLPLGKVEELVGDPVFRKWWNAWDKNQPTPMWTLSSRGEDWH